MENDFAIKIKKLFKNRFFILYLLFAIMGVLIAGRLLNLQVIHGEDNANLATRRILSISKESAARGGIYDRNGVPIATVRTSYQVRISKVNISYAERQACYLKLLNILDANNENYNKKLSAYIKINPIEYGPELRDDNDKLEKWKEDMLGREDTEGILSSPEAIFKWLRDKKFTVREEYSDEEAYKIMIVLYDILINGYTYMNPFATDISRKTVGEIEENATDMPGVSVEEVPVRRYYDAAAASHIIGFIGPIDQKEYEAMKDRGYNRNDWVGKDGVEFYAEKWLKGTDGFRSVEADLFEGTEKVFGITKSIPGSDVMLTIDMNLQKTASNALKNQIAAIREMTFDPANMRDAYAGAVTVLEVKTGEVLAMASYPDFDPSVYLDRSDPFAINTINGWISDSFNAPLLNRAISGMYAPGSTFKLVTAAAAIDTGNLNPNSIFYDPGYYSIDGQQFECVGGSHGDLDLELAIGYSCNSYFHSAGVKTGIESLDRYALLFGLGEKTGIELPGEIAGVRANPDTKMEIWNDIWRPADTAQVAIGQFSQAFTPLQLASYAATIGNNGVRCIPRIIKDVVKSDGSRPEDFSPEVKKVETGVSPEAMARIRQGMHSGTYMPGQYTAYVFADLPVTVACKTGTAETGEEAQGHSSNAIFICIAPADDPEIAISVVIQRGVWGAYCAPVAADIIREYFNDKGTGIQDDIVSRSDMPVLIP